MAKFVLPFEEYLRGWYEIEAETLEEAKAIIEETDLEGYEANYKDGYTDWDISNLSGTLGGD